MKKYVLLLGLLIQVVSVLAQETSVGKSIFSVHAGPSWYLGKMIGITNNSDAYRNDLRNGIAWDANYYFLGDKYIFGSFKLAPGLVYQGGRYKNTHDESSDKILMHYIAPQLALFMVKQKYNLSLSTGVGYQHYKDKSFVSVIYFDNKPALYGSDGIRIYEIMPNSNGFGKAVSNEILKHTSPNSDYEKYKSEAHYIYQKEYTGDDTISVYLNFYAATYSTRFGYVKDESAWMSDAKIDLKLNDNSDYSVVKFTVPQDGSEYNKSIKEMFSNDVYAYYFGDNANNNDSISKELTIQAIKSLVKSNKDIDINKSIETLIKSCLLYTSPSPRDRG